MEAVDSEAFRATVPRGELASTVLAVCHVRTCGSATVSMVEEEQPMARMSGFSSFGPCVTATALLLFLFVLFFSMHPRVNFYRANRAIKYIELYINKFERF